MYPHQSERLSQALARAGLDALIASSPANVAYVTGLLTSGDARSRRYAVYSPRGTALVVPASDLPVLVAEGVAVDHLIGHGALGATFTVPATAETRRIESLAGDVVAEPIEALLVALSRLGARHGPIGLDESGLGHDEWRAFGDRLTESRLTLAAAHLAEARRVKGPYELECLGHALRIAEEALDAVIQVIDRGMTEREAAQLYSGEVVKRGAWPMAARVAIGEGAALPWSWPTDRALRAGDLVRFDVSCTYRGYAGSVARMAVLGEPSERAEAVHASLQIGLETAVGAITPGVVAGRVFDTALARVRASGILDDGGGDVGHGIGLEFREPPTLDAAGTEVLDAGEVLQIELRHVAVGSMGLVLRDTLLVTSAGARSLNRSRRDLIVLD